MVLNDSSSNINIAHVNVGNFMFWDHVLEHSQDGVIM